MTPIIINTKTNLHDTMTSIDSFDAVLEYDPVTKTFKLIISGSFKDGGNMPKSGLTEADWDRIENLIVISIQTAVKPIKEDIEAIKECPTIKKELKK